MCRLASVEVGHTLRIKINYTKVSFYGAEKTVETFVISVKYQINNFRWCLKRVQPTLASSVTRQADQKLYGTFVWISIGRCGIKRFFCVGMYVLLSKIFVLIFNSGVLGVP